MDSYVLNKLILDQEKRQTKLSIFKTNKGINVAGIGAGIGDMISADLSSTRGYNPQIKRKKNRKYVNSQSPKVIKDSSLGISQKFSQSNMDTDNQSPLRNMFNNSNNNVISKGKTSKKELIFKSLISI